MNLSLRAKLRLPEGCSDAQLQEACSRYYALYKGVLNSSSDESVKAIARSRLEDLIAGAKEEQISLWKAEIYDSSAGEVNIPASVEQELSQYSAGALIPDSKANQLFARISALPDSAKRHYLSALLTLRSREGSVDNYREVVSKMKNAVRADPENPVYPAVIDDIEREIARHITDLTLWREERQKEIDAERRKQITKEVFSTIGTVLLWLVGAAFTVAAGVLSCMCSACEGC